MARRNDAKIWEKIPNPSEVRAFDERTPDSYEIDFVDVVLPPVTVAEAIKIANSVLPGDGEEDERRWPAVLAVCKYVESNPEEVWEFVVRWGDHEGEDLRTAIACCGLEHLLEHHFDLIFPRVEKLTRTNALFADTFAGCWKFGQAESEVNAQRIDSLRCELGFGSSLA